VRASHQHQRIARLTLRDAGYEIARVLLARARSYHILVGCRGDINRAHDAIRSMMLLSPATSSFAEPFSVDVSSDESIAAARESITQKFGRLDILVNNAGMPFHIYLSRPTLTIHQALTSIPRCPPDD
jgi:NAD(P)-dependent dehydrogenase (short-subunit alcohol dehydrogenase family)